jgi:hypothetical protein
MATILTQITKTKKPTVGFLIRFVLERFAARFRFNRNHLQRKNSPKTKKTQNKVQNSSRQTPVFLQNQRLF